MKLKIQNLKTPFENANNPWDIYPRPQMKRDSFFSLCGKWELFLINKNEQNFLGEITIPYPPESRISGIFRNLKEGEKYLYKKSFTLPENFQKNRLLLNFGAVDQIAKVYINDKFLYENVGGYLPFTVDITDYIKDGENKIEVIVTDELDKNLPYGKQRKDRGGMWYTPISGIWQSVWLESVSKNYIKDIKITPTLNSVTIKTAGGLENKIIKYINDGEEISFSYNGDEITFEIENPRHWSPEDPYLYHFELTDGEDRIKSYFALRTVSVGEVDNIPYILLNEKPYFFHGLLDQGYFSDGIYTPFSPEGYINDIKVAKDLGFNMLRKHIKAEPDFFYYYCDKMGMVVFQDFINSGKYHYFFDTVLPTVGMHKRFSFPASKKRKEIFESQAKKLMEYLYNHPSVCYYTIFNEGWGQYDADRIYKEMKAIDPTRIYDSTSGWFFEKESDVQSEHVYFRKIDFKKSYNRPLVLSEFGGYSFKIPENSFNLSKTYGYKNFDTAEDFEKGIKDLYYNEVIPAIEKGLCATVLTQISDVEDETNGLLTYDRQKVKVKKETMTKISDEIKKAFYK